MRKMAYDTSNKKNITMNMLSQEKKTNSVSVKCNVKSTYNYCNNDSNVNVVNSSIQDQAILIILGLMYIMNVF